MHHALLVQEILSNIFSYCCPLNLDSYSRKRFAPELVALARTCRAFKEPALNALWSALFDLSPLARCLPDASIRLSGAGMYSFTRPLTQPEWDILRSYTRRIRSIRDFTSGLNQNSIKILAKPPTTWPLFPNLRVLYCDYARKSTPLLHQLLPSLVFLDVQFEKPYLFQESLKLFPKFSPNIRRIHIRVRQLGNAFAEIEPNYFCRWRNLRSVTCPQVALDVDALAHLSQIPALNCLSFALKATFPTSDSPLSFPNLRGLTLHSNSLDPVSRLLSQSRLPVITSFTVSIDSYPSRQELSSFLASVPTCNADHTIEVLRLNQSFPPMSVLRSEASPLGLEDLKPYMAFSNFRHLELDIDCNMDLTDSQALMLAAAWPKLEILKINEHWGWSSPGGITPGGFVQLLQTCRSLREISLALDTRNYTEVHPSHTPENLGSTLPPKLMINFVDSAIEAQSVPAVATFFAGLAKCIKSYFCLDGWSGAPMRGLPNMEENMDRWEDVRNRVDDALGPGSEFGDSDPDIEGDEHQAVHPGKLDGEV